LPLGQTALHAGQLILQLWWRYPLLNLAPRTEPPHVDSMRKRLLAVIAVALPAVTAWPLAALGLRPPVQLPDSATAARGAIRTPSIVGALYDSLSGAPLAGALVHLRGTLITATSDSLGRFRLDHAPAGPQVI
jgi:hypothetical protein